MTTTWDLLGNLAGAGSNIDDLPPADRLDGTELFALSQQNGGRSITTDVLLPSGLQTMVGASGRRLRPGTDFGEVDTDITASAKVPGGRGLQFTMSGTGTKIVQRESNELVHGVARLHTGSTTTGRNAARMLASSAALFDSTERYEAAARVRLEQLSSAVDLFEIRFGFADTWTAAPQQGFFLRAQQADANWEVACYDDNAAVVTGTGIAIGTGWLSMYLKYDNGTLTAEFRDDTDDTAVLEVVSTVISGFPDALESLQPGIGIFKNGGSTGTTDCMLDVDAVGFDYPYALRNPLRVP